MGAESPAAPRDGALRWRLWALVPAILLIGAVSVTVAAGDALDGLVGTSPPPADEFDVRRVEFAPGTISIRVTNPQREALTLAQVTVDDGIYWREQRWARFVAGSGRGKLRRVRNRLVCRWSASPGPSTLGRPA